MLRYPRNLRRTEIQLLITVLLFFTAGYLLIVAASGAQELRLNVRTVADILWPSVLPFLLFLGVSIGMSLRTPHADQLILPLVALLAGLGLLLPGRIHREGVRTMVQRLVDQARQHRQMRVEGVFDPVEHLGHLSTPAVVWRRHTTKLF
jgi:hypothetical protein